MAEKGGNLFARPPRSPTSPGTPRMPQDHTFHYHYLLSYPFAFLSVMVLKLTRTTLPGRRISPKALYNRIASIKAA